MRPKKPTAACSQEMLRSFETCHKTCKGPVIILASGQSARHFDLAHFPDVPVIAMNGSVSMLMGTPIKPFFYVCSDLDFPNQQPELYAWALQHSNNLLLWPERLQEHDIPPVTNRYPLFKARALSLEDWLGTGSLVRSWTFWSKRGRSIGFSRNLSKGFFDARTVAYVALQLACHLGFSEVFLVGVDLDQSVGRFYETGQTGHSPCGLDQHWERRILPSLALMRQRVIDDRFQVYNLSATSRVPTSVIPKIDVAQARALVARHLPG
ncbi:lipopolysaccharide biosynthesis protein [Pseudomonas capeferrum]|uniref:lipopolysaccharide biosynthesis protein n=1 Tax=Pseudomonas capeferrum TaxID=1495066 RepID=UPI0015E43447|nr:lipopolysaccharide biosynthesis protein [Pseudomonas capeferrum]MBA1200661.1 lipopolysaccharide biosynthesis protein [Pseudomonas capeferrum]